MSQPSQETHEPIVELKENTSTVEAAHSRALAPKAEETTAARLAAFIPEDILPICNNSPLLSTEDGQDYLMFLRFLITGIGPSDPIGFMFVVDLRDFDLEIRRLRKLKAGILELSRGKPRDDRRHPLMFDPEIDPPEKDPLWGFIQACGRDPDRQSETTKTPSASRPDGDWKSLGQPKNPPKPRPKSKSETDADTAQAFLNCMGDYERVDKLLEAAESRRSDILRELRIHTEWLSRTHAARNEVINPECTKTSPSGPSPAA
jgi:hypothetical protein